MVGGERAGLERVAGRDLHRCQPHAGIARRIRAVERVTDDGPRRRVRDLDQTVGACPKRLRINSRAEKSQRQA